VSTLGAHAEHTWITPEHMCSPCAQMPILCAPVTEGNLAQIPQLVLKSAKI